MDVVWYGRSGRGMDVVWVDMVMVRVGGIR
jgi:hypothetical protein